ncbi:MAG: Type 1 glutamine amidotransferase-like domain-containing protein [Candidatus Levybacteria bacterium]|nr:Type 1 glutamine amidotransferase-like domain-containing protein [Candidatus Levybacteria bacterium]MBP9815013.1 Type 1 glutamine amidotransferase-like domain-containing protein [Candidatus Levybacteria bacterium]
MKLFLTSYAAYSLDKVIHLLPNMPSTYTVAFIPTASDMYIGERPWIDKDRQALVDFGFKVFNVGLQTDLDEYGYPIIHGEQKTESQLRDELKDVDILFVAGGNTFYLLEQAQKSGFMTIAKEMVKEGKIYIGSSAGSVLAGPDIEAVEFFDDPKEASLSSTKGLGIVDFVVLPHYVEGSYDPDFKKTEEIYGDKYNLLKVENSQVVVVDEKGYRAI